MAESGESRAFEVDVLETVLLLGIPAFAGAIAVGADGGLLTVLLVVAGFFGMVSALMVIGSLQTRASR